MKRSAFALAAFALIALPLSAQNLGRRPNLPNVEPASAPEAPKLLSSNHRITFSAMADGVVLGEVSALTCAQAFTVSGSFDASENPVAMQVTGELREEAEKVVFDYRASFFGSGMPGSVTSRPPQRSQSHPQATLSGTLLLSPGKVYEVFKTAGKVFTVSVTPEED